MEVTRIRALRGPNLWSHHTAIQSIVSCSVAESSVNQLAGFETRLRARFPEIRPLQPTGHDDSIPMAHVLELAALDLQAQAGCPVTFSCTTPTVDAHVYQVVVEYSEEAVGRLAMELAQALCLALTPLSGYLRDCKTRCASCVPLRWRDLYSGPALSRVASCAAVLKDCESYA